MSESVKRLQRELEAWFKEKAKTDANFEVSIRARYAKFKGNVRGKPLSFDDDGIKGSSTNFLIQEIALDKQSTLAPKMHSEQPSTPPTFVLPKEVSYEEGLELAKTINKAGTKTSRGEDFSCQACVALEISNPEKIKEIGSAIARFGTQTQLLQVLAIVTDSKAATQAAKDGYAATGNYTANAVEKLTKNSAFCSIADKLKKSGVIKSGVEGDYYLNNKHVHFKQVGEKKTNKDGTTQNWGASWRPETAADGHQRWGTNYKRWLAENTEKKLQDGSVQKTGLMTVISNLAYAPDVFSTTTILSCGCTGGGKAEETGQKGVTPRDGALDHALNEFMIKSSVAGSRHIEKITTDAKGNKTYTLDSAAAMVMNSPGFDKMKNAHLTTTRTRDKNGNEASITDVVQFKQRFHSESHLEKHGNRTVVVTDYEYKGLYTSKGHEVRTLTKLDDKTTIAVTQLVESKRNLLGTSTSSNIRTVKATQMPDGTQYEEVKIDGMNGTKPIHIQGTGVNKKLEL